MPTIRDIARLAGVSVATVSRIINHSGKVRPETEKKVKQIIQETHYQPNQVARTLYQKRSKMIGIVVPNLNNTFYAQVIDGIQSVLQKNNYSALISFSTSSDGSKYLEAIDNFKNNNVDGIITSAFTPPANWNPTTPLVMYDSADIQDKIVRISSDNSKGGQESVKLIAKNVKKVLVQHWPLSLPTIRERVEAILKELNRQNIAYVLEEVSESDPYLAAQQALNKRNTFDAIITVNDPYAAEIIKEAKRRGVNIPKDFQLVGYDNNILCEYTDPTLSTKDQQPHLIGQTAATRLFKMMAGDTSTNNDIINVIPIKRNSTY